MIEHLALAIAGFARFLAHFGIDVAVASEDVGPAIVIEIEKAGSPAEKARVAPEPGLEGHVFEIVVAQVAIEGRGIAGEVGFEDRELAVAKTSAADTPIPACVLPSAPNATPDSRAMSVKVPS